MTGVRKQAKQGAKEGASGSGSAPKLSELSPKPCLTCGRVITPRSNWARNWDDIKYCSDGCRAQKPGQSTVKIMLRDDQLQRLPPEIQRRLSGPESQPPQAEQGELPLWLAVSSWEVQEGAVLLRVRLEEWVEAAIHRVAASSAASSKSKQDLATCEDVEKLLLDEARAAGASRPGSTDGASAPRQEGVSQGDDSHDSAPSQEPGSALLQKLEAAPGLRERVRRAARRLVLAERYPGFAGRQDEQGQQRAKFVLELRQGARRLETLEDLSFAKGPMYLTLQSHRSGS